MMSIPYRSQWDPDANRRPSDCGQTCVAMVAQAHGVYVRINALPNQSKANGVTSVSDIILNLRFAKLESTWLKLTRNEDLIEGDICLVRYDGFDVTTLQDKKFKGLHWVVFLGLEAGKVRLHDPNFYGVRRSEGASRVVMEVEWDKAFTGMRIVVRVKPKLLKP